jgi:hypothetical protein
MKFTMYLGTLGLATGLVLTGDRGALSAQTRGNGLAITPVSNAALTAPLRDAYGKVKSAAGRELTLDDGGRNLSFIVDDNTEVVVRGNGRAPRHTAGSLPINHFVRSGDVARVLYRELDGAMRVAEIQIRGRSEIASR